MQIVSFENDKNEISKPLFWENISECHLKWPSHNT